MFEIVNVEPGNLVKINNIYVERTNSRPYRLRIKTMGDELLINASIRRTAKVDILTLYSEEDSKKIALQFYKIDDSIYLLEGNNAFVFTPKLKGLEIIHETEKVIYVKYYVERCVGLFCCSKVPVKRGCKSMIQCMKHELLYRDIRYLNGSFVGTVTDEKAVTINEVYLEETFEHWCFNASDKLATIGYTCAYTQNKLWGYRNKDRKIQFPTTILSVEPVVLSNVGATFKQTYQVIRIITAEGMYCHNNVYDYIFGPVDDVRKELKGDRCYVYGIEYNNITNAAFFMIGGGFRRLLKGNYIVSEDILVKNADNEVCETERYFRTDKNLYNDSLVEIVKNVPKSRFSIRCCREENYRSLVGVSEENKILFAMCAKRWPVYRQEYVSKGSRVEELCAGLGDDVIYLSVDGNESFVFDKYGKLKLVADCSHYRMCKGTLEGEPIEAYYLVTGSLKHQWYSSDGEIIEGFKASKSYRNSSGYVNVDPEE